MADSSDLTVELGGADSSSGPLLPSQEKTKSHQFRETNHKVVEKSLSSIKYSVFKKYFPDCKKEDQKYLKACHTQFSEKLKSKILNELENLYKDENIIALLDDIDRLLINCDGDKNDNAWRPTGNPDKDIVPHRIGVKLEAKEMMENLLKELQTEESALKSDICRGETELSNLETKIASQAAKVEKAALACQN